VTQWSRTNGPCNPEFFSTPGLVEVLRSIRVKIQLLDTRDSPINIAPPPFNADRRYPRLHFKGAGVRTLSRTQDDTVVDGHVDRYLDGTIQWTFVSLALDLWSAPEADLMMQVSRYGNVIWMSVVVICNFLLADVTMDPGLTVYSWVRCVVRPGWLVLGHRRSTDVVSVCSTSRVHRQLLTKPPDDPSGTDSLRVSGLIC